MLHEMARWRHSAGIGHPPCCLSLPGPTPSPGNAHAHTSTRARVRLHTRVRGQARPSRGPAKETGGLGRAGRLPLWPVRVAMDTAVDWWCGRGHRMVTRRQRAAGCGNPLILRLVLPDVALCRHVPIPNVSLSHRIPPTAGQGANHKLYSSTYQLFLATNTWRKVLCTPSIPRPRCRHTTSIVAKRYEGRGRGVSSKAGPGRQGRTGTFAGIGLEGSDSTAANPIHSVAACQGGRLTGAYGGTKWLPAKLESVTGKVGRLEMPQGRHRF